MDEITLSFICLYADSHISCCIINVMGNECENHVICTFQYFLNKNIPYRYDALITLSIINFHNILLPNALKNCLVMQDNSSI